MSWLDSALSKLKLPEHIHFHISLFSNNKVDKKVITIDGKEAKLNLPRLTAEERKDLNFPEAIKEGHSLIAEETNVTLEDFKKNESLEENRKILVFLEKKIPVEDLNIWRAALYLRRYYLSDDREKTAILKSQIMQRYGAKGGNIANLCSSDYVTRFFIPLYDSLLEDFGGDNEKATEAFKEKYKIIVNELPFSVFVCWHDTPDKIMKAIEKRKAYGAKYVNIHGIGIENVKHIKEVIEPFEEENYAMIKELKKDKTTIFVKVEFVQYPPELKSS